MSTLHDDPLAPPSYTHARRHDPDTAKSAGEAAQDWEGEEGRRVLEALMECERTTGHGQTAHELTMHLAYFGHAQQNCVSRRLTTLKRHGYVRDTGERRMGGHGRPIAVYASTREGHAWLEGAR